MVNYQKNAISTAVYKNKNTQLICSTLGLVGEAGEVAEKIKKTIRDNDYLFSIEDIELLKLELGDVLWYIASLSDCLGLRLQDVADSNIEKLASRKKRGKISGNGDMR